MRAALIVIDCQNDFMADASPYACQMLDKNLVQKIKKLIQYSRKKNIPIIYTQHSINPDKSNAEFEEPKDVRACIIGTHGWKIIDELKPLKNEHIVRKDKYDAFYNTDMHQILAKLKIDTLILCGVLTNNCVRATAEGAHYRDFGLIVVSDCCGATSYLSDKKHREIHDITLRDLKERMYATEIVLLKDLAGNLK